ncbi:unnamed protein product [Fusarium fujikuroi]|nr:unnamed protein product [Fusarium fujikuroi]
MPLPRMPMSATDAFDTRSRGQTEASPRASKRARTDTETSDKGPNGRNRHRITRACNECRRRKDRCGGQRPSCKSCIDNNRTCSYGPSKKRGLRPGYVRGIETLLGLIFKSIQGSEEWICALLEGVVQQSSFCPASGLNETNISVDLLLETWHKSSVSKKMASLLSTESEFDEEGADSSQIFDTKVVEGLTLLVSTKDTSGAPMTPMDTNTTQPDIPTFDYSPIPIPVSSSPQCLEKTALHTAINRQPEPESRPSNSMSSAAVPDLPKDWSYLLDLYFETTHCWFPISQKHELLRAAYTLSNGAPTTSTSSLSSGELAFLHAVLAYASHQSTTLSSNSCRKPGDIHSLHSPRSLLETSLFANPTIFDLGHVRALLIICLFEMDQNRWPSAWTAIGRAIYTAISLGIFSQGTAVDPPSRDGIKRTTMGCTQLETIVAARLDTLPYLTSSNIFLQDGLLADGNEEWEPWNLKILVEPEYQQDQQNTNSHVPGHVINPTLGSNIEDDGLFDSLATLDSTNWLANPPEFMQHLGMLDDAPDDNTPSHQRLDNQNGSITNPMTHLSDIVPQGAQEDGRKQFYIFGHNISHSLSPTLHNAGFKALNLPHHYQIHESENVDESVESIIQRPDFGGASVTFPHKLQIGKLLGSVSPRGESIGAINTVVVTEFNGGRVLHGDNTDWIGIKRCVEKSGPRDFASSSALVLGAGGAARAACYAVQTLGFGELIVVNRTLSKAEDLASRFPDLKTRVFATLEEASTAKNAQIRLVVACVPADDLGAERIPGSLFSGTGDGVLVEMAYRPQVTGMMTVAERCSGWKVYRGVDVLEEQAYAQFELWIGREAPVEAMRGAMQAKLNEKV